MEKIALIFSLLLTSSIVTAQKLPGTQAGNLYAPAGVKIDGKLTEWDGVFKAYNNATNIFYTLANDKDKLYLIIQATDPLIIRKIVNGGITLTVDNGSVASITYPSFTPATRPAINMDSKPKDGKLLDSFVNVINTRFVGKSKEIKIQGIKAINDTLVSVYNENGIQAAVVFDDKANYNYELAVPLKYFGDPTKFKYTITLNGTRLGQLDGVTITPVNPNTNMFKMSVAVGPGAPKIPNAGERDILTNPTYLKGEYTLAVK